MTTAVVLDTNLLLLLIVGLADVDYIAIHKRLNDYSLRDFILLSDTIDQTGTLILTPNTLTETSNWIDFVRDPARSEIRRVFNVLIANGAEVYVPSKIAAARQEHVDLGITDNVLLEASKDAILISSDWDLCVAAAISNYNCVNFEILRQENLREI